MRKIKKKNRKKFYFTYLLASIVIVLIIILAILLINIDHFNGNSINSSTNNAKLTQKNKANNDKKKKEKELSDTIEPTIINNDTLNDVIEDAQSIDRTYYTEESLLNLDQALEYAQNALQNNASQQDVNDATMNLVNAIIALKSK